MAYRAPKPKPLCESARTWLRLRNGKHCLAPFTGGTSRAFSAYLHLVELWLHSMSPRTVRALREVASMLQPSEWRLAAEAIAHVGDWSHIDALWPQIKPATAPLYYYDARTDRVAAFRDDGAEEDHRS